MKPKNIYDATGDKVGELHFRKQSSDYGLRFNDNNHYANTLVSVNGLDDMGFKNEHEVFTDGN